MSRSFPHPMRVFGIALFVLLTAVLARPARADSDTVEFGSSIDVHDKETVHDAVCFFCSVNLDGEARGDIVVFFGSVHINGRAHHDVVNFFGNVTVGNDASIGHDLVNFFGSVRLGDNVTVGKDTVVMFGSMHAASSASYGGSRVLEPAWLFWGPLITLFLVIYFVVHELRGYRRRRWMRVY